MQILANHQEDYLDKLKPHYFLSHKIHKIQRLYLVILQHKKQVHFFQVQNKVNLYLEVLPYLVRLPKIIKILFFQLGLINQKLVCLVKLLKIHSNLLPYLVIIKMLLIKE